MIAVMIIVDTAACTGCQNCEELCPHIFKLVDGKSNVVGHKIRDCNIEEVLSLCTPRAIKIYDDEF